LVGEVDMFWSNATFGIEIVMGQVLIDIYGPRWPGFILLDKQVLNVEVGELGVPVSDARAPAR